MSFERITEKSSLYNDLEKKSVLEILTEINQEDHKVADAVALAIPQIDKLVTQIVARMKKGGRIFYMGAALQAVLVCSMPRRFLPLSAWTRRGLSA